MRIPLSDRGRFVRIALAAVALVALTLVACSDQKTTPSAPLAPSNLFVQTAAGGTFTPATSGRYSLTLTDVAPSTVEFADRPERSSDVVSTQAFVAGWNQSFGAIPPNAAISLGERGAGGEIAVVTLANPRYNPTNRTLTYDATPIAVELTSGLSRFSDRQKAQLPASFGHSVVFIDSGRSTSAAPAAKVVVVNKSGRADSDIYIALTDGNPGAHAPVQLTATASGAKQYAVPLTTLPTLTGTAGSRYFELDYGAEPGHTTGSLVWLAFGNGVNPQLEVSPTAPSPDWASAVGKTRFANVEQAYVAPTAVNQGDTTYVNQFSIPMDVEACDADGNNCQGLYMKYFTDCVLTATASEVAKFGGTFKGDSGVAHFDAAGNFIRITSPDTNTTGWPVLSGYTSSLKGQGFQISGAFGTVDSTQPTSTPFPSEEGYYQYTGRMREDGVTVLTGTVGRQVNGTAPRAGRDGDTITIAPGDLPGAIYSQAGKYSTTGPDASTPNNNDAYNSVYADFVTGLTSGYWGGKYGNDNSVFGQGSNLPFSAARNTGEGFVGYSPYSEVMWNYSDAYSMPYGERYNNGGHSSPLLTLQDGGQWRVTIHPDTTPGGCAGSWTPPA